MAVARSAGSRRGDGHRVGLVVGVGAVVGRRAGSGEGVRAVLVAVDTFACALRWFRAAGADPARTLTRRPHLFRRHATHGPACRRDHCIDRTLPRDSGAADVAPLRMAILHPELNVP